MKEFLLKLSILLSIAFILFSYYEIWRYLGCHMRHPDGNGYQSLERADSNRVVVICDRHASKPFLNSILDQTVKVDEIGAIDAPYPIVTSYGAQPLKTSLQHERNSKTKLILVDGDTVYTPEFLEELIETSKKYPGFIIYGNESKGVSGGILFTPDSLNETILESSETDSAKRIHQNRRVNTMNTQLSGNYRRIPL